MCPALFVGELMKGDSSQRTYTNDEYATGFELFMRKFNSSSCCRVRPYATVKYACNLGLFEF